MKESLSLTETSMEDNDVNKLQRFRFFFQDWWAEVNHGAKNGGSFSEMMGPSISN